jgi:hypothetical protein
LGLMWVRGGCMRVKREASGVCSRGVKERIDECAG